MEYIDTMLGKVPKSDAKKWLLVIHYMTPIREFYEDDTIDEIMINRFDKIFVEGRSGMVETKAKFESEAALDRFIRQLSIVLDQDDDGLSYLDARFPDQSRACATMPAISPNGCTVTIRCAPKVTLTFADLVQFKSLTQEMADFIKSEVLNYSTILVSGSTGSGKTTILRALADYIPVQDRVITCEDTLELQLDLPNQISLEAPKRKSNSVTLSDLIERTLRMYPNRVFVGEIRNAAACDAFLQVINTGHGGCASSLHANNPRDAIKRIQYLLAKEGLISYEISDKEIRNSIRLFIHAKKTKNGKRIIDISIINEEGELVQIFGYDEDLDSHFRLTP